ncbi:hypothetical protein EDB85DRAFT_1898659 [Lactarius pseudohatsudake]|nr:hypothetical protein EDB85DRAFT_1898659 [Lactarius pseudohatsudake]
MSGAARAAVPVCLLWVVGICVGFDDICVYLRVARNFDLPYSMTLASKVIQSNSVCWRGCCWLRGFTWFSPIALPFYSLANETPSVVHPSSPEHERDELCRSVSGPIVVTSHPDDDSTERIERRAEPPKNSTDDKRSHSALMWRSSSIDQNDNFSFSMPGFENELLQPSSLIAELPGVFQLQGFESPLLTARPPGSTLDLGEDPTTFVANPTADELLAAISLLSPQEKDDPLSSGSAATDPLQVFNFDDYLQDFGGSARQERRLRTGVR